MIRFNKKFFLNKFQFCLLKNNRQKRNFCQIVNVSNESPTQSYLDYFHQNFEKKESAKQQYLQQFLEFSKLDEYTIQKWSQLQNLFDRSENDREIIIQQIDKFFANLIQIQLFEVEDLIRFLRYNKLYTQVLLLLNKITHQKSFQEFQNMINLVLVETFEENCNIKQFELALNLMIKIQDEKNININDGMKYFVKNIMNNIFIDQKTEFLDILQKLNKNQNFLQKLPDLLKDTIQFFSYCKPSNTFQFQFMAQAEAFENINEELFFYLYDRENNARTEKIDKFNEDFLGQEYRDLHLKLALSMKQYKLLKQSKFENSAKTTILSQMACEYNDLEFFVKNSDNTFTGAAKQYFSFNFLKCLLKNIKLNEDIKRNQLINNLIRNCSHEQANQIQLILSLKLNLDNKEVQLVENLFSEAMREQLKQQFSYILQSELNHDIYMRCEKSIEYLCKHAEPKDLFIYTVKLQTRLGYLFDYLLLGEGYKQHDLLQEIGYTGENQQVLGEMEEKTSIQQRGMSKFQPTIRKGFETLCQNELNIKKKVELLYKFEQNEINTLQDLKEKQKELDYDADIDLRIVHNEGNTTFKNDFNNFYYKVQKGVFPVEEIAYKPQDILDVDDIFKLFVYCIIQKNNVNDNVFSKLRYSTYQKQTDQKFQVHIRNFVQTNCQEGLKLAKKYSNLLKCEITQMYEKIQIDMYDYAIDDFKEIDNLSQDKLQIVKSPFYNNLKEEFEKDYVSTQILKQFSLDTMSQDYQNYEKNPEFSIKSSPYKGQISYQEVIDDISKDYQYDDLQEQNMEQEQANLKLKLINGEIQPNVYSAKLKQIDIKLKKMLNKTNIHQRKTGSIQFSDQDYNQEEEQFDFQPFDHFNIQNSPQKTQKKYQSRPEQGQDQNQGQRQKPKRQEREKQDSQNRRYSRYQKQNLKNHSDDKKQNKKKVEGFKDDISDEEDQQIQFILIIQRPLCWYIQNSNYFKSLMKLQLGSTQFLFVFKRCNAPSVEQFLVFIKQAANRVALLDTPQLQCIRTSPLFKLLIIKSITLQKCIKIFSLLLSLRLIIL